MSLQARRSSRMLIPKPTFDLTENVRRTRNNSIKCSHCEQTFLQRYRLEEHLITHHKSVQGKPFKCALCGRKFLEKIGIESHIVNSHKKKSHSCTWCGKGFWNYDKFLVHVNSHQQTGLKCPTCPKTFQYKSALDEHSSLCQTTDSRRRHSGTPATRGAKKKPHCCPHCKEGFERLEVLKEHIDKHHKEFSGSTSNASYMNSFQSFLSERVCRSAEPIGEEYQKKSERKK